MLKVKYESSTLTVILNYCNSNCNNYYKYNLRLSIQLKRIILIISREPESKC